VIILGVSGAGKTTVGKLLARDLGWAFYEADDFHSKANVGKMHAGIPLTDEDRWPWLESLRELVKRCLAPGENAILACSALKKAYRQHLRVNSEVKLVYLSGGLHTHRRRGHFMNPALLRSQFADLEEPRPDEDVLTVELGRTPQDLLPRTTRKNKKSKKSTKKY